MLANRLLRKAARKAVKKSLTNEKERCQAVALQKIDFSFGFKYFQIFKNIEHYWATPRNWVNIFASGPLSPVHKVQSSFLLTGSNGARQTQKFTLRFSV